MRFQGEWLNDKLHGRGIYRHMNGDVYTGQFHENEMQGIGTYVSSDGTRFSGIFKKGVLVEYDAISQDSSSSSALDVFDLKECKDRFGAVAAADAAVAASSTVHMLHERHLLQQQYLHHQHEQQLQREKEEEEKDREQVQDHLRDSDESGLQESLSSNAKIHNSHSLVSAETAYHAEVVPSPRHLSNATQLSSELQTPSYR